MKFCGKHANDVLTYKADRIIFVDETGTDVRDKVRKYEYGVRGKPPVAQKLLVRGQHFSSIAIMSTAGVLDFQVVTGAITGDVFEWFNFTPSDAIQWNQSTQYSSHG